MSRATSDHESMSDEDQEDSQQSETKKDHQEDAEHQQRNPNGTISQEADRPKRNPYCSRCRNHGKTTQVKGHKRHCEYRDCQCDGCWLVKERQIISAAQIKRRRYQKQDEECGRQIEISPPVLIRETNSDSATLIAKSLIASKYPAHSATGQKPLENRAQNNSQASFNQSHHLNLANNVARSLINPDSSRLSLAAASCSLSALQSHQQHPQRQLNPSVPAPTTLADSTNRANLSLANHQNANLSNTALSNALHLFHFPNSMLSGGDVASLSSQVPTNAVITNSLANASASAFQTVAPSHRLPSIREQMNLVEDIYQTFGPLAIYAWLRAEQFDLHKVRDMIETSRSPYNTLLDSKSFYRLNNHNHHNFTISSSNNNNINNNPDNIQASSTKTSESSGKQTSADTSSSLTSAVVSHQHHHHHHHPQQQQQQSTSAPTITTSSYSPLYTTGGASSYADINNLGSSSYINGNNASPTSSALSDHQNHLEHSKHQMNHLSLASTISSLPITSTQSLLWPSLKLSSNAAAAAAAAAAGIHPHHLLPHFMHHHPLMTGSIHPHQQQVSPASMVSNSSPSGSSSSAVL